MCVSIVWGDGGRWVGGTARISRCGCNNFPVRGENLTSFPLFAAGERGMQELFALVDLHFSFI